MMWDLAVQVGKPVTYLTKQMDTEMKDKLAHSHVSS